MIVLLGIGIKIKNQKIFFNMRIKLILLLITISYSFVHSQDKLKLYLECNQEWLCDQDFLRSEITYVDFVRDRFLCDVQIISNVQFTGNGGESNNLIILGQKSFANKKDTISYYNDITATEDIKRKKMLKNIQLSLIPYLMKKGQTDGLEIKFPLSQANINDSSKQNDPFNLWQFTISASGFFNGDRNYSSSNVNNSITAGRETTKSRIMIDLTNNLSRNVFTIYDNEGNLKERLNVSNDRQDGFARYTYKINEHFGTSIQSSFTRSIYDNIDARISAIPQIEYSIFPYKDFNTQRLIVSYGIGVRYFNYKDTTIYLKTKETLLRQSLDMITSLTKPWGSINMGAFWSNYLHDWSKNNFSIGGSISWNVFQGLKFSVGGSYDLIHDQLSLPISGATRDDLLIKRRLIATSYEFFGGVGFSYTFGSIYNSQVNPTFRGLNWGINF
jgi:hypothetical protein